MDTNINYTIVGVFVVTVCAAIIVAIIWLSSGLTFQQYQKYMVYMQDSVSGLSPESPVEYNGVEVGSVENIALNHRDPQIVELTLEIEKDTPITTATIATLKARGLTGITFISLKDESDSRVPLKAKRGQPYPVIRSGPSLFTRIDTALDAFSNNFKELSQAIKKLLDPQNQKAIKDTLQNMEQITGALAKSSDKITVILNNTSTASDQFSSLIQSSQKSLRLIETQTLPMSYRLMSSLTELSRNMTQFSHELKRNPSILLRGAAPAPLGPGEKPR